MTAHGIYRTTAIRSENKPGKVRVVYDAAASYGGTSLNDNLMPCPDLVNSLFGVLQRFRLYETALVADIEAMYHQVFVPEVDTDALRFLWKTNSDSSQAPEVYKMTSHIFGATDSSACANYAVKRCATDNSDSFSPLVVRTALNDFYVDDLLKSVESTSQAIQLSRDLSELLQMGGFHLHKWVSSSSEELSSIPESERAATSKNLDLDELPIQRALGLRWRVGEDCFIFDQNHRTDATNKRDMVSVVSTVFDPCGYLAPYILKAKLIIQELWIRNLDWDEQVPEDILSHWNSWTTGLANLNVFKLQRHHTNFSSDATHVKIHIFVDASEKAYGTVAYLVYVTVKQENKCSFLASKTHIAPVKPIMSIPRLELQAAVLAVRFGKTLQFELHCVNITNIVYWTDSTTVLQYINNKTRRFKPFVANHISEILELSSAEQWHQVITHGSAVHPSC